ncbi:hypothetical protein IQ277_35055, partial [Nostocales cyanobacterium LEGE 12452]|nr:hypothetical protein [Nostocales cyanobacterium LEGE 12452]
MTIDSFSIIPSAQAYKIVRKISKRKVNLVFKECTEKKIGRYVFEQIKIPFNLGADSAVYSIVVFKLENEPGFLSNTSLVEKKYGYILLVEFGGYMFVFKKHVETIDGKFGTDLSPLG